MNLRYRAYMSVLMITMSLVGHSPLQAEDRLVPMFNKPAQTGTTLSIDALASLQMPVAYGFGRIQVDGGRILSKRPSVSLGGTVGLPVSGRVVGDDTSRNTAGFSALALDLWIRKDLTNRAGSAGRIVQEFCVQSGIPTPLSYFGKDFRVGAVGGIGDFFMFGVCYGLAIHYARVVLDVRSSFAFAGSREDRYLDARVFRGSEATISATHPFGASGLTYGATFRPTAIQLNLGYIHTWQRHQLTVGLAPSRSLLWADNRVFYTFPVVASYHLRSM